MKKILNSYEEIRDAIMSGREISLEISAEFEDTHETVAEPTTACKHKIGELVEKNGRRGIYTGEYERKPLILALNDWRKKKNWDTAMKSTPEGWYWSSSEYTHGNAWDVNATNGSVDWHLKNLGTNYVRCVLA